MLLEAGPRLLPAFPERLAGYAERSLAHMGVEVLTANAVVEVDAHGVTTAKHRIDAGTIVWAAGVAASAAATWLDAAHDRSGRVIVDPDLSVPGMPNIFVIGDTAAVNTASGAPVPGIAPAAKQMGQFVAKTIVARITGSKPPARFAYRHYGELATIGRTSAIVKLNGVSLTGFAGWLFWSVAHIYYLIGTRNRFVVAFDWLWNYITFQRGARLISP